MSKQIHFGETVKGYTIPVLNEREIRAAAGILFLFMFIAIMIIVFTGDFTMLKFMITFFMVDMGIRVFINPNYAPTLIMGKWIVNNQTPEYVGAKQKKFAWVIGLVLSVIMFFHLVIFNLSTPLNALICLICLLFLFFETAFGICLGCKFYAMAYKEKAQYCPGEVCEAKDRHAVQKIDKKQLFILLIYILFITTAILLFSEFYSQPPYDILGLEHG